MNIEWQDLDMGGQKGAIGRFGEVNMLALQIVDDRWLALASVQLSPSETQSDQCIVEGRGEAKYTARELAGELLVTLYQHRVNMAQTAYLAGE